MKYIKLWNVVWISAIILLFGTQIVDKNRQTFSTEKWLENPEKRVDIIDNMLERNNLIGKTKEEIIQLLGEATIEEDSNEKKCLVYYLGAERGFISIDSEWLILTLEKDRVVHSEVVTD